MNVQSLRGMSNTSLLDAVELAALGSTSSNETSNCIFARVAVEHHGLQPRRLPVQLERGVGHRLGAQVEHDRMFRDEVVAVRLQRRDVVELRLDRVPLVRRDVDRVGAHGGLVEQVRAGAGAEVPAPPVGDPVPAAPVESLPEPQAAASRQARAAVTSRTGVACFACMYELLAPDTANAVPRARQHNDGAAVTVPAEFRCAPVSRREPLTPSTF